MKYFLKLALFTRLGRVWEVKSLKLGGYMEKLSTETAFLSDHLDERGFKEGDYIVLKPLSGKRIYHAFKYMSLEFTSEKLELKDEKPWIKEISSLKNEKFHIEFIRQNTKGRNNVIKERVLCRSKKDVPFEINGVLAFSAYVEIGDEIRVGYNVLKIVSKTEVIEHPLKKNQVSHDVAKSDLPVLIQGETGTGKSKLAHEIHKKSGRIGEFIHLNLSSFSESLLEAELFGYVRGAFTGAYFDKKGAFEASMHGTLFLDEIDSLSLEMQTKLLLFLDDKKFRAVGDIKVKTTNARIIVASGRDLKYLVTTGKIRKDFYFRLASSHHLVLKPLREDLGLIEKFCEEFSMEQNLFITPKLIDFYKTLPWPGNYRQLKNHLLKKKVFSSGRKLEFDSHDEMLILSSTDLCSIKEIEEKPLTLKELKETYARKTYARFQNNLVYTAKSLGISPKSLKKILNEAY